MKRIVTVSGVDEKTEVSKLIELSKKYDFLEFGILVSEDKTNTGKSNRYPSFSYIDKLIDAKLPLSCHIYGELANEFIGTGDFTKIRKFLTPRRVAGFSRFQLSNKGFENYIPFNIPDDIRIILQASDYKSFQYYWEMNRRLANEDRVGVLYNFSDSNNKLDSLNMVADEDEYVGYTGNVTLDNISYILGYIDGRNENDRDYWIDIENFIRSDDDCFDVHKVEEICNEVIKCENTRLGIK